LVSFFLLEGKITETWEDSTEAAGCRGWGPVVGSFERWNEPFGSIKCEEFVE
jgi:hypothetical protein